MGNQQTKLELQCKVYPELLLKLNKDFIDDPTSINPGLLMELNNQFLNDQHQIDSVSLTKLNNPIPRHNSSDKSTLYRHTICDGGSNRVLSALNLPVGECFPCRSFGPNGENEKIILCNHNGLIYEPNKFS